MPREIRSRKASWKAFVNAALDRIDAERAAAGHAAAAPRKRAKARKSVKNSTTQEASSSKSSRNDSAVEVKDDLFHQTVAETCGLLTQSMQAANDHLRNVDAVDGNANVLEQGAQSAAGQQEDQVQAQANEAGEHSPVTLPTTDRAGLNLLLQAVEYLASKKAVGGEEAGAI